MTPHEANDIAVQKAGPLDGAWNTRYVMALKDLGFTLAKAPPSPDYATLMPPKPLSQFPDRYLYPSVIVPL